jgi:hypothetical protein
MASFFGLEPLIGAWQQCHGSTVFHLPLVQTKVSSSFSLALCQLACHGPDEYMGRKQFTMHGSFRTNPLHHGSTERNRCAS